MYFQRIASIAHTIIASFPTILGGGLLRSLVWRMFFKKSSKFRFADCVVSGHSNIELGFDANFMSGLKLYSDTGVIKIGCHCNFNHNVYLDSNMGGEIIIGDNVLVGPGVVMRASNHKILRIDIPINTQGHEAGKILIGSDVWIASNVTILPGCIIGDGCVIAAGAVVTGVCEPYSIYRGVPARLLRKRS